MLSRFMNRLKILFYFNNLGDTKSLITHPATTTHRVLEEKERLALGITENLFLEFLWDWRFGRYYPRYRPSLLVIYTNPRKLLKKTCNLYVSESRQDETSNFLFSPFSGVVILME